MFLRRLQAFKPYLLDNRFTPNWLKFKTLIYWSLNRHSKAKRHELHHPVTISLTSYPKRFDSLHLTLYCLLSQSIKADKIVLWIAKSDYEILPLKIKALQSYGLTIKQCEDLGSYKKIVPQLLCTESEAYIVTADDDIYYWNTWLEDMISAHQNSDDCIVCHRAYQVTNEIHNGHPVEYSNWVLCNLDEYSGNNLFFTGCGGVLFHTKHFHADTCKKDLFSYLCPTADDVWLNWMVRLGNNDVKKLKSQKIYSWPGSQTLSLSQTNVAGKQNDAQITNIVEYFGNVYL